MLTHGAEDDVLAAADQPYKLSSLMGILQFGNAGLVGKPKILLIQACRGNKYDLGRVQLDSCPSRSTILPTHADTLLIYSSVKGTIYNLFIYSFIDIDNILSIVKNSVSVQHSAGLSF